MTKPYAEIMSQGKLKDGLTGSCTSALVEKLNLPKALKGRNLLSQN
jgi:hypothetical protein